MCYIVHHKFVLQNLPWTRYEGFAYSRVELFHQETYRLYTDNPELYFTGYIHITEHYNSGYSPSSKGSSIGYGSEYRPTFNICQTSVQIVNGA